MTDVCIQHIIRDGEQTSLSWWRARDGAVSHGHGEVDDADVIVTCDQSTADALRDGSLNAQEAFRAGRLRLRGDVAKLVLMYETLTSAE